MAKSKLLVVDDEVDILETIEVLMSDHFDEILTAENAEGALDLYSQNSDDISVIVSDLSMPKAGGIDLLTRVRGINKTVPFILFTGFGEDSEVMLSMKYKAHDFIEKPEYKKLERSIISALKKL